MEAQIPYVVPLQATHLASIVGFVGGYGPSKCQFGLFQIPELNYGRDPSAARRHAVLRVWRTLSRESRAVADDTARLPSVVDHIYFETSSATAVSKTINFFADIVKVPVKGVNFSIDESRMLSPVNNLTVEALASLSKWPELESVELYYCRRLTEKAAAHLAKCAKLKIVLLIDCKNLNVDKVAERLAQCKQLTSGHLGSVLRAIEADRIGACKKVW